MKTTDLMIGSVVTHEDYSDSTFTVSAIDPIKGGSYLIETIGGKNGIWTNPVELINPVPLTENRLLELGAMKINHVDGYVFYSFSRSKKNYRHVDIYLKRTLYMGHTVKHCEYIHELQLLFKATGKELLCQ